VRSVTIGMLTSSSANASALRNHLHETGLATVAVEVTEYCRTRTDSSTRRFMEVQPDVILVEAGEDVAAALISIQLLHTAIPSAWILVCSKAVDSETILNIVRAGARELLPMPVTQEALTQALRRHIEERDRENQTETNANGKIYSICSAKPGCGATTMSINLAASLAENSDARVALIDLDWPLGDAAAFLNIKPRFTVADALGAVGRLDSVLLESYMHKHERVDVLAGLEDFSGTDVFEPVAVSQLLDVVTRAYTHAVLDLPPSLPRQVFQTATSLSSAIVTVVTPDLLSLRRTERLLRVFSAFEVSDKVRLVLNRFHKSDEITDGDIQEALRQPVASKVANDYYACIEAINAGKAVLATSNKHLARNYRELAAELLGQNQAKRKGSLNLRPKPIMSIS
jgi:pilus assembly protein CpaE